MSYKDNNIMKKKEITTLTKNNSNSIYPCVIFCPILHTACQKLPLF